MAFARGSRSKAISDRSGMEFPYDEMVKEWTGALVHISEFEPKQPQLEPKPHTADPTGLLNARPDRTEPAVLILLNPNPFETIKYAGNTYVNVYEPFHGRSAGSTVRFRGPSNATGFGDIPTFDNVTDIDNASGFSIILGKINSSGSITDTTNYYYFVSSSTATSGDVYGGGDNCTAGPVTLSA